MQKSIEVLDRAIEISKEMMDQRGYSVHFYTSNENQGILIEESANYPEIKLISMNPITNDKIYFFFTESEKLNKGIVEKYKNIIQSLTLNHCIFIYRNNITSSAKTLIDKFDSIVENIDSIKIELFIINSLQYNITSHILVPKHERECKETAKLIQKKYGTKLPFILESDPVSKFYGFEKGEIIKITRKIKTLVLQCTYRHICVCSCLCHFNY